ncbi:MAG: hypothetical protein J5986_12445 [Roseburia sp.]|nr:hypothetical protein [Roseburia sp.]
MKWKKIVVILLGLGLFCGGCQKAEKESSWLAENNYENEYGQIEEDGFNSEEGEEEMAEREMTAEQMELLCRISVNEEKVREGRLYDWQKEILNQYDFAMDYLREKYPSHSFQIINCEPKNKLNSYTHFTIIEETAPEDYYSLNINVEESDSGNAYEASDNYYGALKEEEFAEKLFELVQQEVPECIEVNTNMPYVLGSEYGENLDLDMVLNGEIEMAQDTTFIVGSEEKTEEEYEKEAKVLENFVKGRGISGSFAVEFVQNENQENVLYKAYFFGK